MMPRDMSGEFRLQIMVGMNLCVLFILLQTICMTMVMLSCFIKCCSLSCIPSMNLLILSIFLVFL